MTYKVIAVALDRKGRKVPDNDDAEAIVFEVWDSDNTVIATCQQEVDATLICDLINAWENCN